MTLTPVSVEPSARFDNTAFSNVVEDGYALPLHANYTCPRCSGVLRFTKTDFEDRASLRRSNLPESMAATMDARAATNGLASRPFVDWQCPGCGLAARAYAKPWAGGRHGDHGTDIVAVFELDPGELNAR